jgi:predicted Rossmann fold nucleotide-binding protein DprA/Smf involved in DNA uptake
VNDGTASKIDENCLAWLALALSPGLGPKRILDAMRQLETPGQLFALGLTDLEGLRFPAAAAQFVFDGKARTAAEDEWARVAAQGARLVSFSCAEYPERLKEIYDPPPVLVGAGGCETAEPAVDCGGGDAASFALWVGHGGDAGAGPGGAAVADCERDGAGD